MQFGPNYSVQGGLLTWDGTEWAGSGLTTDGVKAVLPIDDMQLGGVAVVGNMPGNTNFAPMPGAANGSPQPFA